MPYQHPVRASKKRLAPGVQDLDPDAVAARGLPPELSAQLSDELRRPLDALRAVAVAKIEESSSAEIADQLGCTERTVRRKLEVIRGLWREEVGDGPAGQD